MSIGISFMKTMSTLKGSNLETSITVKAKPTQKTLSKIFWAMESSHDVLSSCDTYNYQ